MEKQNGSSFFLGRGGEIKAEKKEQKSTSIIFLRKRVMPTRRANLGFGK
jgi:hypothetical protein